MSWPRRHELIDLDLDAYADDTNTYGSGETQPAERPFEQVAEQKRVSVLNAAERAGMPLEELLPKLGWRSAGAAPKRPDAERRGS